ncbi:MAG: hypothetical protein HQL17_02060 [Candidatus Omnitrophica bacterium]|nr:hypothetical protein [Candidatus Omnitrophota bacterium]
MRFLLLMTILMSVAFLATEPCMSQPASEQAPADDAAFVYDPHGSRDPFVPLVTSAGAIISYDAGLIVAEMLLEGIISDGKGNAAIINGNIVEPGQMIGLYKVDSIQKDKVILLKDGQASILQLKKEE